MPRVIVIADDLTGAADTGVCFTRAGLSAAIVFSPGNNSGAEVLVFSSESRYVGESEARKRIHHLLPTANEAVFIYKKRLKSRYVCAHAFSRTQTSPFYNCIMKIEQISNR